MRRGTAREVAGVVVQAAVVAGLAVACARVFNRAITVWSTAGLAFVAVAALHVQRRLGGSVPVARTAYVDADSTSAFGRVEHLWRALDWGSAEGFDRAIRPVLVGLVEDRLRRNHAIDLAAQPDAARACVGDELWHVLASPTGTAPPPIDALERIVARIEAL